MYRYETHLHTSPVSSCARRSVRENMEFYRALGYDGVFLTNHFLDGNFVARRDTEMSYKDKILLFCSDYEESVKIGKEIGLRVFFSVELSYKGTDFLVYGLDKEWFLAHPEIMDMQKSEELPFLISEGALVVQAHPFRESRHIDHIRLFPRAVQGVEVINANRTAFENEMAEHYAAAYGLCRTAGTDNHLGADQVHLAGMESETPLRDVADFIARVKAGTMHLFTVDRSAELAAKA